MDPLNTADHVVSIDPGFVETRAAVNGVALAITRRQPISSSVAKEDVTASASEETVVTRPAPKNVVPAATANDVGSTHARQILVLVGSDERVGSARANEACRRHNRCLGSAALRRHGARSVPGNAQDQNHRGPA
jgi:hypothetical protein